MQVFRVVGTERRLGATHNVEERPRIEGNLPEVWQDAVSVIGGLMRQPSRLVGNRFQAVSEYPASPGRKPCSMPSLTATTACRATASRCGCSTTAWRW